MESIFKKLKGKMMKRYKKEKSNKVDILYEEIDKFLQWLDIKSSEKLLFKYGFSKALEEYKVTYGLEDIINYEPIRMLRCLIHHILLENIDTESE
jgi:hypothetical protein